MIEITPYDPEISAYIARVFNYFNTVINPNNPAKLIIEWVHHPSSTIMAYTSLPNHIYFYPMIIAKYSNNRRDMYYIILNSMIHELFHCDQFIQYKLMGDEIYKRKIEYAVEYQTAKYLSENSESIQNALMFYFDDDIDNSIEMALEYYSNLYEEYERQDFADHLYLLIDIFTDQMYDSSNIHDMIKLAVDNDYSIQVQFNDTIFTAQYPGWRINICDLNEMYEGCFRKSLKRGMLNIKLYKEKKFLSIKVSAETIDIMC